MSKKTAPVPPQVEPDDPEQQAKLDKELGWCIGKIKDGIASEKNAKKSEFQRPRRSLSRLQSSF